MASLVSGDAQQDVGKSGAGTDTLKRLIGRCRERAEFSGTSLVRTRLRSSLKLRSRFFDRFPTFVTTIHFQKELRGEGLTPAYRPRNANFRFGSM